MVEWESRERARDMAALESLSSLTFSCCSLRILALTVLPSSSASSARLPASAAAAWAASRSERRQTSSARSLASAWTEREWERASALAASTVLRRF